MSAPWIFAVPDWQERIRTGKSLLPKLPIDQIEYRRATKIFDKLRLPDVVGKPPLSEAGGEWFREITGTVLGSIDRATGRRQVPELFLMAPKKSSKTSYGAAFMDTALLMNERPRAEFLMVAPTLAIAHLAFNQAIGMIEADEDGFLQKRMQVTPHLRKITDRRTKATLEIKAFDTGILTGIKPAGTLLDELHEIARSPAAQRIIGQIRGGMLPIPESFLAMITTQSDEEPRGAFKSELANARAIRDGQVKGRTLPVLYEFPEDIAKDQTAWKNSKNWWMVTPNINRSVALPDLVEGLERAERDGTDEVVRWASQHLNIEIGLSLRSDAWAGAPFWERRGDPLLTLDELLRRSEICTIGVDGGGLDDLLGLAVIGRDRETKDWLHWGKAWAHRSVLERRKDIAAKLLDLEKAGDLTIPERLGDDVEEVVAIIADIYERKLLPAKGAIGVDPVGIDAITAGLDREGIGGEMIVGVSQGWRLSGTIKSMERRLAEGSFRHGAQPIMAWCVGNAKIVATGNAINVTKQASGSAKIDALMAAFDAAALMAQNPQAAERPKYQVIIF